MFYETNIDKEDTYPNLNQKIKDLFEAAVMEVLESSRDTEEIEFQRRDGFIPASYNRGGVQRSGFTDLMAFYSSGISTGSTKFNTKIDKYIDTDLSEALESFKETNKEALKNIPEDKINYHDLYELNLGSLAEDLSETEHEYLGGDQSLVMVDCRLMYHGENSASFDVGLHASDAPYFRNKHCDSALDISIEWESIADLEKQLKEAVIKLKDFIGHAELY